MKQFLTLLFLTALFAFVTESEARKRCFPVRAPAVQQVIRALDCNRCTMEERFRLIEIQETSFRDAPGSVGHMATANTFLQRARDLKQDWQASLPECISCTDIDSTISFGESLVGSNTN